MALSYVKRFIRLLAGLFLFALGTCFIVQADIGLAPWDAFSMGLSLATGLSFGDIVIVTGILILIVDYAMHEQLGFGTILNALLIGKFIDLIQWGRIVPKMEHYASGIVMLLAGEIILCLATFLYVGAGLGCGPRDALMVALGKRFPKRPIGLIRGIIEGSVLLAGWLLGAKIGIGTVIAVFGIGFILQYTFKLLRFDVTAVHHESLLDTLKIWQGKKGRAD
ncbi:membrane protein [Lachnospiraceae bacterium]|uniref:YczE/YyaS/YitT family protein n=1 Tax=Extibacter sp. GGCC_0201 TaxID=2731209 RepID=UPI001AA12B18|nr:hypothetical protein [Extibacter sp. GGCC_0201]MBO1722446.1 hypothetical protein [Extibacter sp. GGCC_0201]BDF33687.1 membrane protein [Lachnospiraceae bacterium]BDF37691.1 membrane protein [Lachnospiraceae bacterium]